MNTTQALIVIGGLAAIGFAVWMVAIQPGELPMMRSDIPEREGTPYDGKKIVKSEEEWRAILTPEQYQVTRQKGTERACSGAFWNSKDDGVYECVCCGQPLFDSGTKFDSGTGWPSFTDAVEEGRVTIRTDRSHGMVRSEVLCSRCDAHLGHVFPDGPPPAGLRYCINSLALKHVPRLK